MFIAGIGPQHVESFIFQLTPNETRTLGVVLGVLALGYSIHAFRKGVFVIPTAIGSIRLQRTRAPIRFWICEYIYAMAGVKILFYALF